MKSVNLIMGAALAIFFAYSFGGCKVPAPKPPLVDASDASTATLDAALQDACSAACGQLGKLGCPESNTPDGGKSCVQLCRDAEASGKFSLKPMCVSGAQTIEQLKACGTVRCLK